MSAKTGGRDRVATVERQTAETSIDLTLDLDGEGSATIATGIGFFDHMLTLFARHGRFNLNLEARGDLDVDPHHTVEDTGIVLGQAMREALGEKRGIARYGHAYVPMDEALVRAVVDLSGRPYCVYTVPALVPRLGGFDTELCEDFWYAMASNGRFNLHIDSIRGRNSHHIIEASFKAVARALRDAVQTGGWGEQIPSTKGTLGEPNG